MRAVTVQNAVLLLLLLLARLLLLLLLARLLLLLPPHLLSARLADVLVQVQCQQLAALLPARQVKVDGLIHAVNDSIIKVTWRGRGGVGSPSSGGGSELISSNGW